MPLSLQRLFLGRHVKMPDAHSDPDEALAIETKPVGDLERGWKQGRKRFNQFYWRFACDRPSFAEPSPEPLWRLRLKARTW